MRDHETGRKLTDKELIKITLEHMGDGLCFAYECESPEGIALAFILDSAIKYAQCIYRGDDVLMANQNYAAYEQEHYEKVKFGVKR